jgi:oxygen-independent coproporphyrinogen-3 oxidase
VNFSLIDNPRQTIRWDEALIRRYDVAGPRYTSYPTANHFHEEFTLEDYRSACAEGNAANKPLSLYVHIPFCATVCYYCACNKIVTANRARAREYLDLLKREITLQGALFEGSRPVVQLHWGGGTPTFLSGAEMTELMHHTARSFRLLEGDRGEYSIEIDPRTVNEGDVGLLRALGFNRLSLGVQDFNPDVQAAVNRFQTREQVLRVADAARNYGFRSISFDLIYGLPRQTRDSFRRTLDEVIALSPDRLSVFNYAHLPSRFKTQRQIDEAQLPAPAVKLQILQDTIAGLMDAGYVYIGMDHFARPDDELAVALRQGTLQRNFQGYSTRGGADLVGLGLSSIGAVGNTYAQNAKGMAAYADALGQGQLPLERGLAMTPDDLLRRDVIMTLICKGELQMGEIGRRHGIVFWRYFADELTRMEAMQADGLVEINNGLIRISPKGRLLARNVCMLFDQYQAAAPGTGFSRVI